MATQAAVQRFRWDDMPKERVNDLLDRRLITGERMMLAHVYLKKGCIVPMHSHDNEQLTYILSGGLRFWIGDENAESFVLGPGEVLVIPSNVPHKAEARRGHARRRRLLSAASGLDRQDGRVPTEVRLKGSGRERQAQRPRGSRPEGVGKSRSQVGRRRWILKFVVSCGFCAGMQSRPR